MATCEFTIRWTQAQGLSRPLRDLQTSSFQLAAGLWNAYRHWSRTSLPSVGESISFLRSQLRRRPPRFQAGHVPSADCRWMEEKDTMKKLFFASLMILVSATVALGQDPGWPRQRVDHGNTLITYQPQIDDWNNFR